MDAFYEIVDTVWALLRLFWPLWTPMLLMLLARVMLKLYKDARLAKSGLAELDKLGGEDFEKYLELLFRKLDYKVTRTPYQGDYGADLVLQQDGVQTVVQVKRYDRNVGVKAIQEAVAAKEYYKANKAMVVTNSYYSQQAKKLAKANHVELWDRNKLVTLLLAMKQAPTRAAPVTTNTNQISVASTLAPPVSMTTTVCATCGKTVAPQVSNYCLTHSERFGGQVYCYDHQKRIRHQNGKAKKPVRAS